MYSLVVFGKDGECTLLNTSHIFTMEFSGLTRLPGWLFDESTINRLQTVIFAGSFK